MKIQLSSVTALTLIPCFTLASLSVGCKSREAANSTASIGSTSSQASTASTPTRSVLTVDDLVAPIALYPDQLLAQILIASTNPQEVLDGGNWLIQHQHLTGDAAINEAKKAGFGSSMQYLMAFPQVVDNMCQEMDWTTKLGQAYNNDSKAVMDAVQRKRSQAQQLGNLSSNPYMAVEKRQSEKAQYIEIRPANPKVVYVPQYNPITIYNTPAPPPAAPAATTTTTTTSTASSGVSTGTAVAIGLLSFGVGMAVGSTFKNNNYYYPYPAWGYGRIYYAGRPYYPPPYRPPYPTQLPAYGYDPPPNYRWTQYNQNVNVNINNNYYTRFQNQTSSTQLPANTTASLANKPSTLPTNGGVASQPDWKGQSTYLGARSGNVNQQTPGASMANALPETARTNRGEGKQAPNREAKRQYPGTVPGNRVANHGTLPVGRDTRDTRPSAQPNTDRTGNVGGANRSNRSSRTAAGGTPTQPNLNQGGDRGYANSSQSRIGSQSQSVPNRGANPNAFGGSNGGASDRAASRRGRSSMGAGGARGTRRSG